jgi:hypothetical protein
VFGKSLLAGSKWMGFCVEHLGKVVLTFRIDHGVGVVFSMLISFASWGGM